MTDKELLDELADAVGYYYNTLRHLKYACLPQSLIERLVADYHEMVVSGCVSAGLMGSSCGCGDETPETNTTMSA
jgi:hypothetical protein